MNIREARLPLLVLTLGLALAFVIAPRTRGQRERHTCRQECSRKYQECRAGENADEAQCEKAFDDCREECVGTSPKPEDKSAAAANAAREGRAGAKAGAARSSANASENSSADTNVNCGAGANVNGNGGGCSRNSGGSEGPPRPPAQKDSSSRPPAAHR